MNTTTSIENLIAENPSGLLQLQPSMSIPEYREKFGFKLKNTHEIFESKRSHHSKQDWFAFRTVKSLGELLRVQKEHDSGLLVVYIVETIKAGRVFCNLVLTDQAFQEILEDKTQHVSKIHQMYSQFWKDNIALNMAN